MDDERRGGCPNCGHDLVTERIASGSAGARSVRLHWMICVSCGHVALNEWTFLEGTAERHETHRSAGHRD